MSEYENSVLAKFCRDRAGPQCIGARYGEAKYAAIELNVNILYVVCRPMIRVYMDKYRSIVGISNEAIANGN